MSEHLRSTSGEILIAQSPLDLRFGLVFYQLNDIIHGSPVFLKLEGFNPAGSIKLKPAIEMLRSYEERGEITPGKSHIIESSSGNLGIALSIACKMKGYNFTCVSDPNLNELARRYIELYGGNLVIIRKPDSNGGFLASRIEYIKGLLRTNRNYVWLNQYASPENKLAHYKQTATEIFTSFPQVDYLFVGAGTTGTLMGCIEYVRDHSHKTEIIAVDALGSVTFGLPPQKRRIPGLGTSRRPELLQPELVDNLEVIPEEETIMTCWALLEEHGLFVGGSTGTVLAGVRRRANTIGPNKTVVAISPDFGDRYIDTVYNRSWVLEHFPALREPTLENKAAQQAAQHPPLS